MRCMDEDQPDVSDTREHWDLKDQMFSVNHMYRVVESYAKREHAGQTAASLPYAAQKHSGQFRKGNGHVPYIYHPLVMACHALALQLDEDDLIASLLLHDVCEDCRDENGERIRPEDLPAGPAVQEAVRLVTKPEAGGAYEGWEDDYYAGIAGNRLAVIVKVLDRCNNISMMAAGFSRQKMAEYIVETEKYVMPLVDLMREEYGRKPVGSRREEPGSIAQSAKSEDLFYNAAFLIKYQMLSDLENLKRLL